MGTYLIHVTSNEINIWTKVKKKSLVAVILVPINSGFANIYLNDSKFDSIRQKPRWFTFSLSGRELIVKTNGLCKEF